jgi:hypothetical protein
MGVDVPDDFAGKMKGEKKKKKGPQQSANDDDGSDSFYILGLLLFNGRRGKRQRKKKGEPQIKLAGYTPIDLFGRRDCLFSPRGYYSTTTLLGGKGPPPSFLNSS